MFIPNHDIKKCVLFLFSEVCDLQKQLAQHGHLKTHSDLEEFYRCIRYHEHPSQLQRSLQDVRTKSKYYLVIFVSWIILYILYVSLSNITKHNMLTMLV